MALLITSLEKEIKSLQVELKSNKDVCKQQLDASERIFQNTIKTEDDKYKSLEKAFKKQQILYENALKSRSNRQLTWYNNFISCALLNGVLCTSAILITNR